ncbi:L-2-amino-thiazoline-4-carboxylic acid hydrolase [Clostridium estertheticum]|uniref:L-2-amino-thiazoline-4-carboxylic acid hydrolase n=1 Tax=Clostridium estertheticum TaxID=238834 RepID=UPI00124DEA05|nr:L-2-amino-thiazoline-4-carboxylic acid hydrolase [Clostridium estertheticum]MBZ9618433.1 L-2-amino-thiazoline-4-carboxylic acid hydrolase [Clostridium estertheticum subsp. laramiense]WAG76330.1 L-2-amino-thiazoline-4-carboxylic acid hydrolase [Clostridium estertheticum]
MIKTNIDKPAKPEVPLIILGVLKGYLDDADAFMEKTMESRKEIVKKISQENPQHPTEFVNIVSIVAALYSELKKDMKNEKALSLVKASFLPVGLAMQMGNFRYVEDKHTFENLINYQQRTNKQGPTQLNRMEIIKQNNKTYEFHVHNCMFKDEFSRLGMPELTAVMCAIDNVVFNAYLPGKVTFHRNGTGNTIIDGMQYCTFICQNIG